MSRAQGNSAAALHYANLPSIEQLNQQFPQLEVDRLVGRGGMGAIYHARQTALDREVALKLIARDIASDTAFIERFEREAKTLARLSHPNIVTVYDFGRTADGQAYLIMEFIDGINLREALNAKSIGPEDALEIVSSICKALAYAHSKGIVHRDIKPENILLGEDGTLKVADFGIAKLLDQSAGTPALTATRQVLGSLNYLAPEQLEAPDQVDHRVDLYALGVVFYELLTGQLPLGRYEPPSALVGQPLDHRIDAIVMKTLSRKPLQRYQQATELDSALLDVRSKLAGNGHSASTVAPVPSISTPRDASVPFTCETMGGLAEVVGVLYASPTELRAEFRTRDAIWGQLKSDTKVVSIPTSKLRIAELRPGMFSSKIVLMADSISTFDHLPNSETGRVELKIKGVDHNQAVELINTLGITSLTPTPRPMPVVGELPADRTRWTILAIMFVLCSVINMGCLAITQVIIASELEGRDQAIGSIAAAILLSPIFLLQLLTGTLSLIVRPRALAVATSIVSLLPVTPGWIVSFPLGIWSLNWLQQSNLGNASKRLPPSNSKSWGATTLLFIRESRWSKFVALANMGGLVLAIGLIAGYRGGYYPSTLEYRVVDQRVDSQLLRDALSTRLPNVTIEIIEVKPSLLLARNGETAAVQLHTLSNQRARIIEQLKYEGNVQLQWLAKASAQKDENVDAIQPTQPWPAAPQLPLNEAVARSATPLGEQLLGCGEVLTLTPDMVSKLAESKSATESIEQFMLSLEFSSKGRELLNTAAPSGNQTAGLALIVDGIVHGFASHEQISHAETLFKLSRASGATPAAIMAAIRGPELPTELELLP
jgi:serine/threonine protein kinase